MIILWATCGKDWGFRFLLDGGFDDPLPLYEKAFSLLGDGGRFHRFGTTVALRFPDPQGRKDAAGRIIPHDFVLYGHNDLLPHSFDEAFQLVWPLVADSFAEIWDQPKAPAKLSIKPIIE